jgi:hypothetical protein
MNTVHRWILSCALALAAGCASTGQQTQQPRIAEVTHTSHIKGYPLAEQREEFYVVWTGAGVSLVKIEYRQVNFPNELFAKSYVPTVRRSHVFTVGGGEFQKGGKVSAWRVSLWRDNQPLTEQKSALW